LPETSILIPEAGCGQSPRKEAAGMFYFGAKNQKNLYKGVQIGNTLISKINRQQNQAQDST
jgi:hypothetical protein